MKSPLAQAVVPVAAGIGFFGLVALALWGISAWLSHHSGPNGSVRVRVASTYLDVGRIDKVADRISATGPYLLPGLSGSAEKNPIGVYHSGGDDAAGWTAFVLVPAGSEAKCAVFFDRVALQLTNPCTNARFANDGSGLPPVQWSIDASKHLIVTPRPA